VRQWFTRDRAVGDVEHPQQVRCHVSGHRSLALPGTKSQLQPLALEPVGGLALHPLRGGFPEALPHGFGPVVLQRQTAESMEVVAEPPPGLDGVEGV
jgi:hypothetical protein